MYTPNNQIKKGPSVDEVRSKSSDGKVKTEQVLTFGANRQQLSVEDARAAMIAAGEAPSGDTSAKAGQTANSSDDTKTRWQKAARPSTITKTDLPRAEKQTPAPQPVVESASGYLVRFTYSDGRVETFQVANRVKMIGEVKRRQAYLMSKGLKAEVEVISLDDTQDFPVEEVTPEVVPTEVAPAPQTRGQGGSTRSDAQTERSENSKFTLEIFQEDGEWVGRISYKNGAGTEEFRADTRKALDMKLLEGKAHATLKVREVLRRDQYHDDLDKVYDIQGYSQEAFDALSAEAQGLVIDSIAAKAALDFRENTPEFYGSALNTKTLLTFLHKRNLPVSVKNLKYAFEENADDLEQRPRATRSATAEDTLAPAVATVAGDSAPTPAAEPVAASVAPAPALATPTEVRKRGSFGFKPGFTSTGNSELEETGSGKKTTEPLEKDARSMPLEELAKQVRKGYKPNRQF